MVQAQAKAYAAPFAAAGKPVWLVGLSFNRTTKCFVEGVVEKIS